MEDAEKIPKRFYLLRTKDVSGVSGEGIVAYGCCFCNGKCILVWQGAHSSVNEYDSQSDLEFVHGHEGSTQVVWID